MIGKKIYCAMGAVVEFLLRPVGRMWAFTASVLVVYASLKYGLKADCIQLKYVIPELLATALVISLLKKPWRTVAEWMFIVLTGCLSAVEVWLMHHFKLELGCQSLQLLMETNSAEASEFLESFVWKIATLKYVGVLLGAFAIAAGIYWLRASQRLAPLAKKCALHGRMAWAAKIGVICVVAMVYFVRTDWVAMQPRLAYALMGNSVSEMESRLIAGEEAGGCGVCTPLSRTLYGTRLYCLTTRQCDEILEVARTTRISACRRPSGTIMLWIGESSIKRHSQLYGYPLPTTPCVMDEMKKGNLVAIGDAITMVCRTSDVFKEMLSMHSIDQVGSWASQPMMPHLFRLAGYRVSFISNQYGNFNHEVWNSTGAFFLTNPEVSALLTDYRNKQNYRFDEGLLGEVNTQLRKPDARQFVMLHVRGQHVSFEYGYPENRRYFTADSYPHRKDLTAEQKQWVAHYDNCTRYQDSIAGTLFHQYADRDMVIVMVSDHGENVYDDGKTMGRVHNDYSRAILESQYQVPMWIWMSNKYQALHPEMAAKIRKAANRPFEIDDIPHLMLELAGIDCPYFDATRSLINDRFNTHRHRLVGDQRLEYDKLF
ncbi:MAG: sulfatase-like hydrolase/transferase [Sodaliphilus sp.]